MINKLIFLELNEINIDYVKHYINKGHLKNWKKIILEFGCTDTICDYNYENIEPWIIWPSIRTGLSNKEHRIFHLGEKGNIKYKQHWELIEKKGYSVAAISPINGFNFVEKSKFWVPDPWVNTKISGSKLIKLFSTTLKQVVNDNAKQQITLKSYSILFISLIVFAKLSNYFYYLKQLFYIIACKQKWRKAIILDRLLSESFLHLWYLHKPDFSTIFLNAGAHLQHHYLYNSSAYNGKNKNPTWYIKHSEDPLLEVLKSYDLIIGECLKKQDVRLMIATGLSQIPYENDTYYWRIKNHNKFLNKLGVIYELVEPRMSRDFNIKFKNENNAIDAEQIFNSIEDIHGLKIFGLIERKKCEVFITLTYSNNIYKNFDVKINKNKKIISNFDNEVVFVAKKNGHHIGKGFFCDTKKQLEIPKDIKIEDIFNIIMDNYK